MITRPATGDDGALAWFKSSHSPGDSNDCVEVANTPESVQVRDSKDTADARLTFSSNSWAHFVSYAAS